MTTTIGIDIRMLARGHKTGIEEYTAELLEHLLPIDPRLEFKLFYNGYRKDQLDYPWLKLPNVQLCESSYPNRLLDAAFRVGSYPKADKLLGGVDKFFSPHIFLAPVSSKCEKIVTFHDLSFEKYPEFYSRPKNFWHYSMAPRRQARSADKLIAVSDSTKQDLIELYGIDPEKIRVIYSGLSEKTKRLVLPEEKAYVKRKHQLPDDFILYLGTLEPRKNIISLLLAFEKAKTAGALKGTDFKLVIAGAKGWLYGDIFKTAQRFRCKEDILFTGPIADKDKPALYELAKLFVYPSFYEGFGFPPLEAMARHTPVITSNLSSIPEAVGDAALTVNPAQPDEIKQAMERILLDPGLAHELGERGRRRAREFDWKKCAWETLYYIVS